MSSTNSNEGTGAEGLGNARPANTNQKPSPGSFADSLYIGNALKCSSSPKRDALAGPVVSLNTNGTKARNENGVSELFRYAHETNAKIICIQDHRRNKHTATGLQSLAKFIWLHELKNRDEMRMSTSYGNKTTKHTRIGGTCVLVHPDLAPYVVQTFTDPKFGRWSGVILEGKNRGTNRSTTAVISLYLPTISSKDRINSMWQFQKRGIAQSNCPEYRKLDPWSAAIHDLTLECAKLTKKHKCSFVITGDWNRDITQADANTSSKINKFCSLFKLSNYQNEWHTQKPHTYVRNIEVDSHRSWIDHTLISTASSDIGAITGCGVLAHQQIANSDHRLVFTGVDFRNMLNIDKPCERSDSSRPRTLKATDAKLSADYYQRCKQASGYRQVTKRCRSIFKIAQRHKREKSKRKEIQQEGLRCLRDLVRFVLTIEDDMEASRPKMSNTKKSGYSKWFIQKRSRLRRTVTYFRIAKASRDHKKAERMARQLNSAYGAKLSLSNIPTTRKREQWSEWLETSRTHISGLTNELDSRHRTKARTEVNNNLRKLEAHRQISREKGKYYCYIKLTKKGSKPPLSVATKNKDGSLTMHIGEEAVMAAENIYLPEHMGGKPNPYYLHPTHKHPMLSLDKQGRKARKCYQRGDSDTLPGIPAMFQPIFEMTRNKTDAHTNQPVKASIYGDLFTSEIDVELFDNIIKSKAKNKAPGKSNVRIDHIAAAPAKLREAFRQILSLPYLCGIKYKDWQNEIIAWLPKEPGNPDIARRRPIALLDVLKKLCFGAKKHEFLSIATEHGLLHPEHYGALQDKSTTEPIIKKILALEDSITSGNPLITADIDLRRAFDMVPHWVKEMSLRRIGMPEEGIELWSSFDKTKQTSSITAYGLSNPITPVAGSFGQGAEESPAGFVIFLCWLSDYLDTLPLDNYNLSHSPNNAGLTQSFFVDDSTFAQSTAAGMQRLLDGVCLFCHATCMEINFGKSFWTEMNYTTWNCNLTEELTLWNWTTDHTATLWTGGTQSRIPMTKKHKKEYWKYLGHYTNNLGDGKKMLEELYEKDVKPQIEYMRNKPMSQGAVIECIRTLIDSKVLYKLQFATVTENMLTNLQNYIRVFLKQKMKLCKSTHNEIVHGSTVALGLGIDTLWDQMNARKLRILTALLNNDTAASQCALNAMKAAQYCMGGTRPFWTYPRPSHYTTWISSIWDWMHTNDITLHLSDSTLLNIQQPVYENDVNIVDLLHNAQLTRTAALTKIEGRLEASSSSHLNQQFNTLLKQTIELNKYIDATIKKRKFWLSDITTDKLSERKIADFRLLGISTTDLKSLGRRIVRNNCLTGQHCTLEGTLYKITLHVPGRICMAQPKGMFTQRTTRRSNLQKAITALDNRASATQIDVSLATVVDVATNKHGKPTHILNTCVAVFNGKTAHSPETSEALYEDILGISTADLDDIPNMGITAGGADGSLDNDKCSYGWTAGHIRRDYLPSTNGNGLIGASSAKNSSTRAEAFGILCGLIIAEMGYTHIEWYCDSEAAINTYKKITRLNYSEWLDLANTDVWAAVYQIKLEHGYKFDLKWVRSHVDDKSSQHFISPEYRQPQHQINILCDKLADEGMLKPAPPLSQQLWGQQSVRIYYEDRPYLKPLGNLLEEIKWKRIKKLMSNKPQIWGEIEHLSLDDMRTIYGKTNICLRVRHMKIRWGLLATNHINMIRNLCPPSDNRCPLCGVLGDTNHHMLYACEYPAQKRIQQQFLTKIGELLSAEAVEPTERDTIVDFWRNSQEFTQKDSHLASALLSIAENNTSPYASLTHTPLNAALAELGLGKRIKAINKGINDAVCELHHALYVNRAKTSALPKQSTSELNDKITDIFARGYLLSRNTLTLPEVLSYKRKAKLKFVRTYSKYAVNTTAQASIRRPWEDIPRSTATSIIVGCKVRSVSLTAQCDQQEGVVNSTDQHEAVVEWTHPSGEHTLERLPSSRIHPIVVGALGHTQAEASIIDTKFKRSTKSRTEYVCRINGKRTDKNLATYTTIDTNGRIQSTPHDTILTAQRLALIPSRIVCKQRKRSVLSKRKIKTTIQELTTEKEAPLAPTTVRSGIDDDDHSSDEDITTYEDNPSHTSSSDNSDEEDHSLSAKQILHDSAD